MVSTCSYRKNFYDSFIVADPNSFLIPYEILSIAQERKYLEHLREICLIYFKKILYVYSLESPRRGNSKYMQHTIILYKRSILF